MKKSLITILALTMLVTVIGCGKKEVSYKDGTFTGKSSIYMSEDGTDDGNGYGEITITIENQKITACKFYTYEPDGKLKDEEYGKADGEIANRDFYNKAQKAVASCQEYEKQIVAKGELKGIDAISGATINYNAMEEAMSNALDEAKIKE